jgi:hypothetical protein
MLRQLAPRRSTLKLPSLLIARRKVPVTCCVKPGSKEGFCILSILLFRRSLDSRTLLKAVRKNEAHIQSPEREPLAGGKIGTAPTEKAPCRPDALSSSRYRLRAPEIVRHPVPCASR